MVLSIHKMILAWAGLITLWLLPQIVVAEQSPEVMLEQAAEQMLAALREHDSELRNDPQQLHALVDEVLVPHVDLQVVSRWVLGKYWRTATPEQRRRFAEEFKKMLIRFYSSALLEYADFKFRFYPPRMKKGARRAVVRSDVMRSGGPPHSVNYSLIWRDGQWKVYDVTIDGVSVVTTYRSSFAEEIRHGGLDGLLKKMTEWNRQEVSPSEGKKAGG